MNTKDRTSDGKGRTWGVCVVCMPRESYWWLDDWIGHYVKAGASKVVVYDNTGSMGSSRRSSVFSTGGFQKKQESKRGEAYGELTRDLSDEDIQGRLHDIARSYGDGVVEVVRWAPVDETTGRIVHGQVEAYVDFIRRYRDELGWGVFVDMDEYIYCAPGLTVDDVIARLEENEPSIGLLQMRGWRFECRWSATGPKDILSLDRHRPMQWGGEKNLARLDAVTHANIHWDWEILPEYERALGNGYDVAFCHYNQKPEDMEDALCEIEPREFLQAARVEGTPLRLDNPYLPMGAELTAPLSVN